MLYFFLYVSPFRSYILLWNIFCLLSENFSTQYLILFLMSPLLSFCLNNGSSCNLMISCSSPSLCRLGGITIELNWVSKLFLFSSSSSIGTATLVDFSLLNYRWVFSAERFLQSVVAGGTSNPQPGGPVIRTFQLPPPGVRHVWNDASDPQQRKVELWARNGREFCRKWRLPRHFWVLTVWDRRLYFPSEGRHAEDFFARKFRRLRPGLNPRTRVPEASTLTSRPPKPLILVSLIYITSKLQCINRYLDTVVTQHVVECKCGRYTL